MKPPLALPAKLLAAELPDLTNQRAALNLLASAGYPPRPMAIYIEDIIAMARLERARTADAITAREARL